MGSVGGTGGRVGKIRVAVAAVALVAVTAGIPVVGSDTPRGGTGAGASGVFTDVGPGHPFSTEIGWLAASGVTTGFADGTFRPMGVVTRQAMAAFLYRLAGSPGGPFPDAGFTDVGPGHPFRTEIGWLAASGVTTGFPDGTFRPSLEVLRQAMAAFLYRGRHLCWGCPDPIPTDALLGVHALFSPALADQLGVDMVRVIVHDEAIAAARAALDAGEVPEFVQRLIDFDEAGIEVVLTLRWPVNPGEPFSDPDRVPRGAEREAALEQVDWLVRSLEGRIRYLQLNNEPLGGPGRYEPEDAQDALEWLAEVAATIRAAHADAGGEEDLWIIAGGLTGVDRVVDGTAGAWLTVAVEALISFAEEHADLVDLHLHATGVDSMVRQLDWLTDRTDLPVVVLEWSQADAAAGWLTEAPAPAFAHLGATNRDVILGAYEQRLPPAVWRDFVASSPHTPGFIEAGWRAMVERGVVMAAYGGAVQYGQPKFDLKALQANMTAIGGGPNQPFYDDLVALASSR